MLLFIITGSANKKKWCCSNSFRWPIPLIILLYLLIKCHIFLLTIVQYPPTHPYFRCCPSNTCYPMLHVTKVTNYCVKLHQSLLINRMSLDWSNQPVKCQSHNCLIYTAQRFLLCTPCLLIVFSALENNHFQSKINAQEYKTVESVGRTLIPRAHVSITLVEYIKLTESGSWQI